VDASYCGASDDCQGDNVGEACGVDTPAGDSCVDGVCTGERHPLSNGDFTTGLMGWTTKNNPKPDPSQNDFSSVFEAVTGQALTTSSTGPCARVLFQDFEIPTALSTAKFSFVVYLQASTTYDPGNIKVIEKDPSDMLMGGLQNGVRIDIIDAAGSAFDGMVLYELYAPTVGVGTPAVLSPIGTSDPALLQFLQQNEGKTLRLRIGSVESTMPFDVIFDDLDLTLIGH
jgi:hypothetical protein